MPVGNRDASYRYRLEVLFAFQMAFLEVRNADVTRSLSQRLLDGSERGDILGIDTWLFKVRNARNIDFSEAMDAARFEAQAASVENFAAIQSHRNRSINDSYVVMPLSQLTRLLRDGMSAQLHSEERDGIARTE
ncbi:hypothetical protein [Frondihabitans cladoniiphilus]|uniref:Uncharacterized protein n=1 Tax=Frondihabitans cladoniiphilus TaxID=715785 RepID=A0ABP8W1Z3_9MICO